MLMNFTLTMMDFIRKMIDSMLKMMDFILKMMECYPDREQRDAARMMSSGLEPRKAHDMMTKVQSRL